MSSGVPCPFCGDTESAVKDSRQAGPETPGIRRRRLCGGCGNRFTTYEVAEQKLDKVPAYLVRRMREELDAAVDAVAMAAAKLSVSRRSFQKAKDHVSDFGNGS